MENNSVENENITSVFKVALFLGSSLDESFYSVLEKAVELKHVSSRNSFIYEGYEFYLCSQDNHLNWLGEANTLKEAKQVEHFAQQFLIEYGFYDKK